VLDARRSELRALQEGLREFKARYAQIVGRRLAELSEIERAIRTAEKRRLGIADAPGAESDETVTEDGADESDLEPLPAKAALRKLFWAIARMFHPDHAANEHEAQRRHSIMAEASRAYREGDAASLHTLLGDEELQSFCASGHGVSAVEDLNGRVLRLQEELRTIEFGIKRIRQDGLYRLKLSVEEAAGQGRDALDEMAQRIDRQISKARRRLEHLS
jgi:hypothetical protein